NDPAKARELRNGVQKMLRETGFKDNEVDSAWKGQNGVSLRDHRVQLIIRKAALYDKMMERSKEIQRKPLPPAQKPGTVAVNRAAEDTEGKIAAIQKQLETASGTKALRLGNELHQLMRKAGRT